MSISQRQNEKIAFEINELQAVGAFESRIKRFLPVVTALIAVAGFWFGLFQYIRAEAASLAQRKQAEAARSEQQKAADELFLRELKRETAKPLWEKQLSLYLEAAENASTIATTEDETIRNRSRSKVLGPITGGRLRQFRM